MGIKIYLIKDIILNNNHSLLQSILLDLNLYLTLNVNQMKILAKEMRYILKTLGMIPKIDQFQLFNS